MKRICRMIIEMFLSVLILVIKLGTWMGSKLARPILLILGIGVLLAIGFGEWIQFKILLGTMGIIGGVMILITLIQILLENALYRIKGNV